MKHKEICTYTAVSQNKEYEAIMKSMTQGTLNNQFAGYSLPEPVDVPLESLLPENILPKFNMLIGINKEKFDISNPHLKDTEGKLERKISEVKNSQ